MTLDAAPAAPKRGQAPPPVVAGRPTGAAAAPRAPVTTRAARPAGYAPTHRVRRAAAQGDKFAYLPRRQWLLTVGSLAAMPPLVWSQWHLGAADPRLWLVVPFLLLSPALTLISGITDGLTPGFDRDRHRRLVAGWRPDRHPSVDVMLPTCGEPLPLLRRTWTAVAALRSAYPGPVAVSVLDDSARPEVAALARAHGFRCHVRPHRGWFKKSGNLYHGICNSSGDYIVILDADFVPRPEFLRETLPYFDAEPDLGILQTPQHFRDRPDQTWVERGAASVQEHFYRAIQVARDRWGAVICCGTNAVYRRTAIEANGGISLIAHSEDIHTGLDLQRLGWRTRYLPVILAVGLCPDTVASFFKQQYRWCMGTLSLVRSASFWRTRTGGMARLCYLSGLLYYVETALMVVVAPVVGILMCTALADTVRWWHLVFVAPSLLYSFVVLPLWHRGRYGLETWSTRLVYGWAHLWALWDNLRDQEMGWTPSGAGRGAGGVGRFWAGVLLWSVPTALAWLGLASWRMARWDTHAFIAMFVLAAFYAVTVARVLVPVREVSDDA